MVGYWFLGLIVSIPLAITIVSLVNNFTDWNNLWEFSEIEYMIEEYKRNKETENDNQ
jgi:uncharacterized membrane protein